MFRKIFNFKVELLYLVAVATIAFLFKKLGVSNEVLQYFLIGSFLAMVVETAYNGLKITFKKN